MALLTAPPDSWVTLPDTGSDQIVEARGSGLYVDTTGALDHADRAEANSMPALTSIVIAADVIAAGVQITSGNSKPAWVYHGPI
jgi:hypothetical protein